MQISQFFSSFGRDERGSAVVLFVLTLVPVLGVIGAAVDATRWYSARRVVSTAVDTALLAGARKMQFDPGQSQEAIALAQQYFQNNLATRVTLVDSTLSFALTDNDTAMSLQGAAYINTTLLRFAGVTKLKVSSPAKATFQQSGSNGGSDLEIALSLDVTGSMCDDGAGPCTTGTKISGLKDASKELVDIILNKGSAGTTSRIALVPFSTSVRVGPDGGGATIMNALTALTPTWSGYVQECGGGWSETGGSEGNSTWTCASLVSTYYSNLKVRPCVTDRFYDNSWTFETTDAAPANGIWLNAHSGSRGPYFVDSSQTPLSTGKGDTAADPSTHWNYDSYGDCTDVAPANEVMPLTKSASDLNARIDGLQGYGSTAGALATTMNFYMLSPKFGSVWPSASKPGPYSDLTTKNSKGAPVLRKVTVIMSDGDFNTFRSWKEQNQQFVSDAAVETCSRMKAEGIEIYTVGFALDQLTSAKRAIAEDTLKKCGTDLSHFYSSLTVPELKMAFRDIALKVSPVRLTQ